MTLPGGLPFECRPLVERWLARGVFSEQRHHAGLWLLETRDGHQCVIVPSTGRIQLRIHPVVEPAARAAVAWTLAKQLAG